MLLWCEGAIASELQLRKLVVNYPTQLHNNDPDCGGPIVAAVAIGGRHCGYDRRTLPGSVVENCYAAVL